MLGVSGLAAIGQRGREAALVNRVVATTKAAADEAVHSVVQQVHARHPGSTRATGSGPASALSGGLVGGLDASQVAAVAEHERLSGKRTFGETAVGDAADGEGPERGVVRLRENRRVRGGLSRLHAERFGGSPLALPQAPRGALPLPLHRRS